MIKNEESIFYLIIPFVLLFVLILPFPNYSQTYFTAIHCEPDHPNLVPELPNLVASADSFNIPLRIMLSPPWTEIILENRISNISFTK